MAHPSGGLRNRATFLVYPETLSYVSRRRFVAEKEKIRRVSESERENESVETIDRTDATTLARVVYERDEEKKEEEKKRRNIDVP